MVLAFRGYPLRPDHIPMPGKNAGLPGFCRAPFSGRNAVQFCSGRALNPRRSAERKSRADFFLAASRTVPQDSLSN